MIGIIDYKAGNIKSVERALKAIGQDYTISQSPKDLISCDKYIFPGVGQASYAMCSLKEVGFDSFLKDIVAQGKNLLGICLGAQILFDFSEEDNTQCLGFIKGSVRHFYRVWEENNIPYSKVPHMGWNDIKLTNGGLPLLEGLEGKDFYFVHSYLMQPEVKSVTKAVAFYPDNKEGISQAIPCVVAQDNIVACQFHPEKSGKYGMTILERFCSSVS